MLLGTLVATLVHAGIETPLLSWMTSDLELGRTNRLWNYWPIVHRLGGSILWLAGAALGFYFGKKFWRILYIEKRYGTPRW